MPQQAGDIWNGQEDSEGDAAMQGEESARCTHLQELGMFLELVVEDEVVAEGTEEQVKGEGAQVGDDKKAEELAARLVLGPPRRVHVGGQQVPVRGFQHQIHGGSCRNQSCVTARRCPSPARRGNGAVAGWDAVRLAGTARQTWHMQLWV